MMSKRVKRSRKKWNAKVFCRNLVTLLILGSSITLMALGLVWGMEQESKVNEQMVRQWKAEMQTPNN